MTAEVIFYGNLPLPSICNPFFSAPLSLSFPVCYIALLCVSFNTALSFSSFCLYLRPDGEPHKIFLRPFSSSKLKNIVYYFFGSLISFFFIVMPEISRLIFKIIPQKCSIKATILWPILFSDLWILKWQKGRYYILLVKSALWMRKCCFTLCNVLLSLIFSAIEFVRWVLMVQ